MLDFTRLLSNNILAEEKATFSCPINKQELKLAVEAMAQDKCPSPDGLIIEFYKNY